MIVTDPWENNRDVNTQLLTQIQDSYQCFSCNRGNIYIPKLYIVLGKGAHIDLHSELLWGFGVMVLGKVAHIDLHSESLWGFGVVVN